MASVAEVETPLAAIALEAAGSVAETEQTIVLPQSVTASILELPQPGVVADAYEAVSSAEVEATLIGASTNAPAGSPEGDSTSLGVFAVVTAVMSETDVSGVSQVLIASGPIIELDTPLGQEPPQVAGAVTEVESTASLDTAAATASVLEIGGPSAADVPTAVASVLELGGPSATDVPASPGSITESETAGSADVPTAVASVLETGAPSATPTQTAPAAANEVEAPAAAVSMASVALVAEAEQTASDAQVTSGASVTEGDTAFSSTLTVVTAASAENDQLGEAVVTTALLPTLLGDADATGAGVLIQTAISLLELDHTRTSSTPGMAPMLAPQLSPPASGASLVFGSLVTAGQVVPMTGKPAAGTGGMTASERAVGNAPTVFQATARAAGISSMTGTGLAQVIDTGSTANGLMAALSGAGAISNALANSATAAAFSALSAAGRSATDVESGNTGMVASLAAVVTTRSGTVLGATLAAVSSFSAVGRAADQIVGGTAGAVADAAFGLVYQTAIPVYGTAHCDATSSFVPTLGSTSSYQYAQGDGTSSLSADGHAVVVFFYGTAKSDGASALTAAGAQVSVTVSLEMDASSSLRASGGLALLFAPASELDGSSALSAAGVDVDTFHATAEADATSAMIAGGGLALLFAPPTTLAGFATMAPSGNQTVVAGTGKCDGFAMLSATLLPAIVSGSGEGDATSALVAQASQSITALFANLYTFASLSATGGRGLPLGSARCDATSAMSVSFSVSQHYAGAAESDGTSTLSAAGQVVLLFATAEGDGASSLSATGRATDRALTAVLAGVSSLTAKLTNVFSFNIDGHADLVAQASASAGSQAVSLAKATMAGYASLSVAGNSTAVTTGGESDALATLAISGAVYPSSTARAEADGFSQLSVSMDGSYSLTTQGVSALVADIAAENLHTIFTVVDSIVLAVFSELNAVHAGVRSTNTSAVNGMVADLFVTSQEIDPQFFGTAKSEGTSICFAVGETATVTAGGVAQLVATQGQEIQQIVVTTVDSILLEAAGALNALGVATTLFTGGKATLLAGMRAYIGSDIHSITRLVATATLSSYGTREVSPGIAMAAQAYLSGDGVVEENRSTMLAEATLVTAPTIEYGIHMNALATLAEQVNVYTGRLRRFVRGMWVGQDARAYTPGLAPSATGTWRAVPLKVYDRGEWRKVR